MSSIQVKCEDIFFSQVQSNTCQHLSYWYFSSHVSHLVSCHQDLLQQNLSIVYQPIYRQTFFNTKHSLKVTLPNIVRKRKKREVHNSSEFSSRVLQNLTAKISINKRVIQVDANMVISGTTSILYPKLNNFRIW